MIIPALRNCNKKTNVQLLSYSDTIEHTPQSRRNLFFLGKFTLLVILLAFRGSQWRGQMGVQLLYMLLNFVQRRLILFDLRPLRSLSEYWMMIRLGQSSSLLVVAEICRNKEDENRLQNLKDKAIHRKVENNVEFHKNLMYRDLVQLLGGAIGGIHSMTDEHFGISVVEYMAVDAIPIAHNYAGPKMDIVLEEDGLKTGFLASSVEEYADAIPELLRILESKRLEMAAGATKHYNRYSEQRFSENFKVAIQPVFSLQ